jgi:hypothetical protein
MPTRSTTSAFQPSPPSYRLNRGRFAAVLSLIQATSHEGNKSNMCCPPATNGSREKGLAPSQPDAAKKMMAMRPSVGN